MKLHADRHDDLNAFTAYGDDWVEVNGERHSGALLVRPRGPVDVWDVASFEALNAERLLALLDAPADQPDWRPEVILLGTGAQLRFPHPQLTRPLLQAGVGVESMDTLAACRTYNILMAEGRQVLAALLDTGLR
ncbi:MAG: Mth938-like domain-containing protein [Lautropia sp.]|nr:Mth938-like domain-containing protein [Lautropia sp.]